MTAHSEERPLYQGLRLPLRTSIRILGLPVRFRTNSPAALAAVEHSFGRWRAVRAGVSGPEVTVSIIEHEGREQPGPVVPVWRMGGDRRLMAFSAGSAGVADFDAREVFIYASPAFLADRDQFSWGMLEGFVLTTVGTVDRTPLHAGSLVRHGTVLLLSGPSGTGKSTLAFAALQRGFGLIADDATYVQLRPRFQVWGVNRRVCLLPETRPFFPSLDGIEPSLLISGKTKIEAPVTGPLAARVPVRPRRATVVLLERTGAGRAQLERVSAPTVRATLARDLELTLALFPLAKAAIARVSRAGGWRLHLSADPHEAVPFLEKIATHRRR